MTLTKSERFQLRKERVKKNIHGTAACPRLAVFRSSKHIYGQLIDDDKACTLVAASDMLPGLKAALEGKKKAERAQAVGEYLGKKAVEAGISSVVFDRSGFAYHGRVKSFAEGVRSGGLKF